MITNDIFTSFIHCHRKAFLRNTGTTGQYTDFEIVMLDLGQTFRRLSIQAFLDFGRQALSLAEATNPILTW
jgi:hypothetical protein